METLLAVGWLLLPLVSAHALEAGRFELHAVAKVASEHTRGYSTVADADLPAEMVFLDQTVLLDGTAVQTLNLIPAHAGTSLYLNIEFTPEGKQRFGELTTRYLHQRLGVVVDGRLMIAPTIQTIIYGGNITVGKDPHESPYPNFWLPFLHPDPSSPSLAPSKRNPS